MNLLSIVGARPQFIKLAPIAHAASVLGVRHTIVHTGQHYDAAMSENFFADLAIPPPDHNLAIGSRSHGAQTGAMMAGLEPLLESTSPDWVLIYGDTNSTLAAALVASKLHIRVAHLEAGLRSHNRAMPEEINRVVADHLSDLCLAPTQAAMGHLATEGLHDRAHLVGDVMVDALVSVAHRVKSDPVESPIPTGGSHPEYILATFHRPENTDDPARLRSIVDALSTFRQPIYLAVHPRLAARARSFGIDINVGRVKTVSPLSYPQLVQALSGATALITDSGGLQKEAYMLRVATSTLRPETEWPETLENDCNVLVADPSDLVRSVGRSAPTRWLHEPFGDGQAAERSLAVITSPMLEVHIGEAS